MYDCGSIIQRETNNLRFIFSFFFPEISSDLTFIDHFTVESYFLLSQESGTGIIQIFIDLLSSESIADSISILVQSGQNVG